MAIGDESAYERSPNYPSYSLESAIQFAGMLYAAEKRTTVPLEIAAKAMGSDSLSGPMRRKIGALRQYGLVEDAGRAKIRISDRALAILQKPTFDKYTTALKEAALSPALFAELNEHHPDASDGALRFYLQTERKFSDEGANRAVRSFKDTLQFVKLASGSYNGGGEESTKEPPPAPVVSDLIRNGVGIGKSTASTFRLPTLTFAREPGLSLSWRLPDRVTVEVKFEGEPTVKALDRLITLLDLLRGDVSEEERGAKMERNDRQTAAADSDSNL